MPHKYNERVFATPDLAAHLVPVYLLLVGIELALKNFRPANWSLGHQIDLMLAPLGKPALLALAQTVMLALQCLWCEQKGGGAGRVSSACYPGIRYLRHDSDHQHNCSSDGDLLALRNALNDLAAELRREGILQ
jgi:hypothetical protein